MGRRRAVAPTAFARGRLHAIPRAARSTMPPMTYTVFDSTSVSASSASGDRYTTLDGGTASASASEDEPSPHSPFMNMSWTSRGSLLTSDHRSALKWSRA